MQPEYDTRYPSVQDLRARAQARIPRFAFESLGRLNRIAWLLVAAVCSACDDVPSREQTLSAMTPYLGAHAGDDADDTPSVEAHGLSGKVLCGYQGWFSVPGDGSGRGWYHYTPRIFFAPGSAGIEMWPDVSELDDDERHDTPFRHADGRPAQVFSSTNPKTVRRHFRWMREGGIDGVFVQRFAVETQHDKGLHQATEVLRLCREAANLEGRVYAVMYDLSGLPAGGTAVVKRDWKALVDGMALGRDEGDHAYLHLDDRPLVAVWGLGFHDRAYGLDEGRELVEWLADDPDYGGNAVMVGLPSFWRTHHRDCVDDERVLAIAQAADVISPWSVGRAWSAETTAELTDVVWPADRAWCDERGIEFLPVVHPGFSWHNRFSNAPQDAVPRRRGQLFWELASGARRSGARALYVAMFDELDEATAIFKVTNDPPVGKTRFLDYEGLPSDHYLWLTGEAGRLIRGELETSDIPVREFEQAR